MDRGAWWPTAQRVTESQTRLKQLSTQTCMHGEHLKSHGLRVKVSFCRVKVIFCPVQTEVFKNMSSIKLRDFSVCGR